MPSHAADCIALTDLQVGSTRVVQATGVYLLLFGLLGKFGALFVTIPDPVIGGVFLVMFGKARCILSAAVYCIVLLVTEACRLLGLLVCSHSTV